MSTLSHKVREEILKLIPPTIYFLAGLTLITIIRMLMLEGTGLPLSTPLELFLAALIMGKSVLLADMIPFINRYPGKPLIYNVAWKTLIYMIVATLLHYVERLIHFWRESGSFAAANQALLERMIWPHFWAVEIVIGLLVIIYCTITELSRALGADNMHAIFFTRAPHEIVLPSAVKS